MAEKDRNTRAGRGYITTDKQQRGTAGSYYSKFTKYLGAGVGPVFMGSVGDPGAGPVVAPFGGASSENGGYGGYGHKDLPIVDNENCLPCPTAIIKKIKCHRSTKILDNKAGCGYKGIGGVTNPHVDPGKKPFKYKDKFGNTKWGHTEGPVVAPFGGASTSGPVIDIPGLGPTAITPASAAGSGLPFVAAPFGGALSGPLLAIDPSTKFGGAAMAGPVVAPFGGASAGSGPVVAPFGGAGAPATVEQLVMDVVVCLYDRMDDYGVTGWIKNKNLTKYLKLHVIQCTNAEVAKVLVNGGFRRLVKNGMVRNEHLEAKHISLTKEANLTRFAPIVNEVTGEKVYRIEYKFRFALRSPNVDHLSYYAGCFFDSDELITEYGLDSCTALGPIRCETSFINVFHKGYRIKDKRILCGRPLTKLIPPVTDTKEYEDDPEDPIITENAGKCLPYFSSLCMSRDCDNNCKFIFGADYKRIIREKSRFGYLVTSPYFNIVERLLRATTIRTMKIYRFNAELATGQEFASIIDGMESCERGMAETFTGGAGMSLGTEEALSPYHVIENQKKQYPIKGRKIVNRDFSGYDPFTTPGPDQVLLGSLDEVALYRSFNTQIPFALRHFNVGDYHISQIKGEGTYQYGVFVQIEDNILRYLLNLLKMLRRMQLQLEKYYEEAIMPCNYNSYTESFFEHYVDSLYERFPDGSRWKDPIGVFVEILMVFFFKEYSNPDSLKEVVETMSYKLNPNTATPDTILEVIQAIGEVLSMLYEILGIDVSDLASSSDSDADPASKPVAKPGLIELEHIFKEKFTKELIENVGFDYLGCDPIDIPGAAIDYGSVGY